MLPLEGIVLVDGFGQRDLWFVGLCGNGGLQEHSPHAMIVGGVFWLLLADLERHMSFYLGMSFLPGVVEVW